MTNTAEVSNENKFVTGTSGFGKTFIDMKYQGFPDGRVTVNGQPLPLCLDIINHSPTGFSYGYEGSGCAQLALAIMICEFGRDLELHPVSYQEFKRGIIAKFPQNKPFELTTSEVKAWIQNYLTNQENRSLWQF